MAGSISWGASIWARPAGRSWPAAAIWASCSTNIYRHLRGWLAERAAQLKLKNAPKSVSDPNRQQKLLAETARIYEENQGAMAKMAAGVGAKFITVLEPNRYGTSYAHVTPDLD